MTPCRRSSLRGVSFAIFRNGAFARCYIRMPFSFSATMPRHAEKVLAHAEQQLRDQGQLKGAELLSLYKKFLKIENHRIRLKHQSGGGGREICEQRAHLVDIVLRHLLEAAIEADSGASPLPSLALVAIGGYGRGELNPYSDVDIMFLHEDSMRKLDPRL